MDYARLLFSFRGRINRARYLVVQLALLTVWFLFWVKAPFQQWEVLGWVVAIAMIWINLAVTAKRLHDRNMSGWWMIPFIVATGLYNQFGHWLGDSWAATLIGWPVFICFTWGLVEMCFLKGMPRPNRFGPDPLPPIDKQPRWDQESEVTFVPPSAGPPPGPHVMRGT